MALTLHWRNLGNVVFLYVREEGLKEELANVYLCVWDTCFSCHFRMFLSTPYTCQPPLLLETWPRAVVVGWEEKQVIFTFQKYLLYIWFHWHLNQERILIFVLRTLVTKWRVLAKGRLWQDLIVLSWVSYDVEQVWVEAGHWRGGLWDHPGWDNQGLD